MPSELSFQQQTPINGTIPVMVPPGNQTGYYYIPIANLPWQTSWQELKDHVRTVCFVEHVQINEDSTSGHVVLKGRANFDAAFRLLNGGIFHDRALIADGRNRDDWVLVKHHVDVPMSTPKSPPTSKHRASAQPMSPPMTQSSPSYSEWSSTSTSPSYMMIPVVSTSSYPVPCTMSDYTDSAAIYGMGSYSHGYSGTMTTSALPCSSGPDYTAHCTTSEQYGNTYPVANGEPTSREGKKQYVMPSSADTITIRKRKIIIRQLHPWASETQIRDLIRQKAGSDAAKLQKVDIPLADGQQGMNRGYAFATFETEEAANKVIKRLNNYHFEGRILEAKHTKEGVSDNQSSHGSRSSHQRHSHHSHHSRRERHDEKERKGKEKENSHKASSSGEKKSKSSSSKSDVIIAHGSSVSYV
ncbi:hypothetical protein GGS21DRAFT_470009 [Xylaria nigripes]|nr:hypothetical protein GGS21DRAFT_470009 [Xylaria nigripes]